MKEWFPFTDYDFYAYISSEAVVVCAFDYCLTGGTFVLHNNWNIPKGIAVGFTFYICEQILALPSSILLEHLTTKFILRSPVVVLLGQNLSLKWYERTMGVLIGRYYSPLPDTVIQKVLDRAQIDTGKSHTDLLTNSDRIFFPAYDMARKNEDVRKRLDDFRNQYGFSRNMSFSAAISTLLLSIRAFNYETPFEWWWAGIALFISISMFVRFWKFFSSFSAEVLRHYAFVP